MAALLWHWGTSRGSWPAELKSHSSSGSRSRSTARATLSLPARGAGAWQRGLLSHHAGLFLESILSLGKPPLRFLCVCGVILQTEFEKWVERRGCNVVHVGEP